MCDHLSHKLKESPGERLGMMMFIREESGIEDPESGSYTWF